MASLGANGGQVSGPKRGPASSKRLERCPRCSSWCTQKTSGNYPDTVVTKTCMNCKSVYTEEVAQTYIDQERAKISRDAVPRDTQRTRDPLRHPGRYEERRDRPRY